MNEASRPVDLTVRRSDRDGNRLIRVIAEPPTITTRPVTLLPSETASQLAAALIVAAGQADEPDRELSARSTP